MDLIKLPQEVAQDFDLVKQPSQDNLYFGSEVGQVTFSKITRSQAVKLVKLRCPYLKVKTGKEEKETVVAKVK